MSPASGSPVGAARARLEVDQVAGGQRGPPPGDEPGPRTEREMAPLPGLEEEVVEPIEGGGVGLGRRHEPLTRAARIDARVVAHDRDLGLLGAADPLPGGLRDPLEDGRLVDAGRERQRDAVARGLDLLDGMEAGRLDRGAEGALGVGDLGVRGDHVDPLPRQRVADRDQARGEGRRIGAHRHRAARHVRAAAADHRPATAQGERSTAIVADEEPWPPSRRPAVFGPRERLVDVAAGRIDRPGVPVGEFLRACFAEVQSAAP